MLFAALSNAACLYDASFFAIDFCKCFLFSCSVLVYWHIVCLFHVLICIMHSAFNLFVFPNSMFTPLLFFKWKGYVLSEEIALTNNHYYYYKIAHNKKFCCSFGNDFPEQNLLLYYIYQYP